MIDLTVQIQDQKTIITTDKEALQLTVYTTDKPVTVKEEKGILLYYKEQIPQAAALLDKPNDPEAYDTVIFLAVSWEIEAHALAQVLIDAWQANQLTVTPLFPTTKVPVNTYPTLAEYQATIFTILQTFGFHNSKVKKKPAKAQHRWNKQVSDIPFYIDYNQASGVAIWQKRNELVLKAGANLTQKMPLNKDGSVGFGARLAEKLRADHMSQIKDFTTIEDIIFKSVNELGTFLYFAGTNGWLVLKDQNGKTIDEYTVVK